MVQLKPPASPGSPAARIERELAEGGVILLDGATGTELERRGAAMHPEVWCAMATLEAPETLRAVHEDYIRAGSRVITANTFSNHRIMLGPAGLGERSVELTRRAVEIALEARDRLGAGDTVAVAGSMSHQVPLQAGTDYRDPAQLPSPELREAAFREMARTLSDSGVDLILLEMMSDPALANPAIAAARATGLPVWIGYSCRGNPRGEPVSFTLEDLDAAAMLRSTPVEGAGAIGIMHTNVGLVSPAIEAFRRQWEGPIMAYPDTGHFEMPNWVWKDAISPADFSAATLRWIEEGARIVGGCCGTGVAHIDALANTLGRSAP